MVDAGTIKGQACGATASLCALEVLAHSNALPINMVFIEVEIPDSLVVTSLEEADLPSGWNDPVAPNSTKDIGGKWVAGKSSVVLSLPSAVVPQERNYLISPSHPDFSQIKFSAPQPFIFDPRLKPATS